MTMASAFDVLLQTLNENIFKHKYCDRFFM